MDTCPCLVMTVRQGFLPKAISGLDSIIVFCLRISLSIDEMLSVETLSISGLLRVLFASTVGFVSASLL